MTFPVDVAGFLAIYIIVIIVVVVVQIGLAVWVYRDAKAHGKDGAIWLIVVLLGGCVGCIVYLILRDEPSSSNPRNY